MSSSTRTFAVRPWITAAALLLVGAGVWFALSLVDAEEDRTPPRPDALSTTSAPTYVPHPMLWALRGSAPEDYSFEYVPDSQSHQTLVRLRSSTDEPDGFGTLRRAVGAEEFLGGSVVFAAEMKMEGESPASLWLRADDAAGATLDYVSLDDDLLSASGVEWAERMVSMQVPDDAETILFGVYLDGPGTIWMRAPTLASRAPR